MHVPLTHTEAGTLYDILYPGGLELAQGVRQQKSAKQGEPLELSHKADFLTLEGKERPNGLELLNPKKTGLEIQLYYSHLKTGTVPIETGAWHRVRQNFQIMRFETKKKECLGPVWDMALLSVQL